MSVNTLRVYDAARFHDVDMPDWYHEAQRLSDKDRLDWHRALDRVLGCECTLLTEEGMIAAGIEIRFWSSPVQGIFVALETPLAIVEEVVVMNPTDWLPFLSIYLAPLIATSTQSAVLEVQGKIANTLIAYARHGEGNHVDRETGLSRIDLDNDRDRRLAAQFRQAVTHSGKGAGA